MFVKVLMRLIRAFRVLKRSELEASLSEIHQRHMSWHIFQFDLRLIHIKVAVDTVVQECILYRKRREISTSLHEEYRFTLG